MNAISPPHPQLRRFTTADVLAMIEAGVLSRDEKLELIEGELYVLSPKHNRHEIYKRRLATRFARMLSDAQELGVEQTLYLSDDPKDNTFLEPDLMVVPAGQLPEDTRPSDTLLVIEVADMSLDYDLKRKAAIYARHGAPCLWVIDASVNVAYVLTAPAGNSYASVEIVNADEPLTAPFDPSITVRLADLVR
jgi:Uma2 family endonuclease